LGLMECMVDTCIINWLVDGRIQTADLPDDLEYVATHIQVDEISRTPDAERRTRLLTKFAERVAECVPTETAVLGVSRLNHCKLGSGTIYGAVKRQLDRRNGGKANNTHDALIAEVAIMNGYELLTCDRDLVEVAREHGVKVRGFTFGERGA